MPEHRIIDMLDGDTRERGRRSAHRLMIGKSMLPSGRPHPDDVPALERTILAYEVAAADYWRFAFDTDPKNTSKKSDLHAICRECASLMAVCPTPEQPVQKMVYVLRLFAYAYLGEAWEGMKRYIRESESVWETGLEDGSPWDYRLLSGIYKAVLHLGRKESWDDLSEAAGIIAQLRNEQERFEKGYLDGTGQSGRAGSALQLLALYHLAKAVEMAGTYMGQGTPHDIEDYLNLHFRNARKCSQGAGAAELDMVLMMLHAALKKMVRNSIWIVSKRVNSKVAHFVKTMTESTRPVFELLYPQRLAILERGLLDPASRAVVVNLPTSSGKTLMAEFRILQMLNTFGRTGIAVYVVPTRTLVNQVAARLRRDLGAEPLDVRIAKMSGAVEIDGFEESVLGDQGSYDVLVTTPEKLLLLLRNPQGALAGAIRLAIIDEAHNIADDARGLNLEMLVSTISRDCPDAHLLLLTPFIPNSDDIAGWLDPQNPKSISLEFAWKPNERVVGIYHAEGRRRDIRILFRPLNTIEGTISVDDVITVGAGKFSLPVSKIKNSKHALTALLATQFGSSQSILALGGDPAKAWGMARLIYDNMEGGFEPDDKVRLVMRFVKSEMGPDFPLATYLEKGIGVHHAGLPDEIRQLMEWLMESGSIRVLVATTTIAQGVNFPVSGILVSTYHMGRSKMTSRDFWNLLGRAGRIDQPSIGVVGLAATDEEDRLATMRYVRQETDNLVSTLVGMVDAALAEHGRLDLSVLARQPSWSAFIQYITHMKNQSDDLELFLEGAELALQRTYGYGQLDAGGQEKVLEAVRDYARMLDGKPDVSMLSDLTGFTPETIEDAMDAVRTSGMSPEDWSAPTLFSAASGKMAAMVGVMRSDITEVKRMMDVEIGRRTLTNDAISGIISDWVAGRDMAEIASAHFGEGGGAMTNCVKTIYTRIINGATWGMAGIQKMSGLDLDAMPAGERRRLASLPAMIYYGVNTEEAVLMRMHSVPRRIAAGLGRAYGERGDVYANAPGVLEWLDALPDGAWNPPPGTGMTGGDYKRVWRQLSGMRADS